jgi:hypothetical protein
MIEGAAFRAIAAKVAAHLLGRVRPERGQAPRIAVVK